MNIATSHNRAHPAQAPRTALRDARAERLFRQGLALAERKCWTEAARSYESALARCPKDFLLWLHLARARLKLDEFTTGADAACRALALEPGNELALKIAATCMQCSGRERDLVTLFDSVNRQSIGDPELHLQLGAALFRLGRGTEAVQAIFDSLRRDPRNFEAFAQLGTVFQLMHMPLEARESFRNALALGAPSVEMLSAIVFTSLQAASWDNLAQDMTALDAAVQTTGEWPPPFFCLNFSWNRQQQLAAMRSKARQLFDSIEPLPARGGRRLGDRIRVGYVSGDLHEHATAYLVAELFERHDRARFDIYAYSYGDNDGSAMRERIEKSFGGNFRDARELSNKALAQLIRSDAIDVLIDLKGYTLHTRSEVFAYRAAPLQVNFLGFPGSLGSELYDYVIGDPIVTPLEDADGYAEKIAQMPGCYQPNDRRRPLPPAATREECGLPSDAFVFCSFNANYKITPQVFDRWCALLRAAPDAVLWLFVTNHQARHNLAQEAAQRGVDPARLFWAQTVPIAQHVARVQAADLFLDTMPVNAHTTASDALWAGVPLVTTLGETFVSRVAASLLHAAGVSELIAKDLAAYEQIALNLVRDRGKLQALRGRLQSTRHSSTLFDTKRYVGEFETLISQIVVRNDQGLRPDHVPSPGLA